MSEAIERKQYEERLSKARRAANILLAADTNPEELAAKKRLADILGVPLSAVEADPETAKRMAARRIIEADTVDTPVLRQKYEDPDFAMLAHDQSGNLGKLERAVRNLAAGFGGDFAGSSVAGIGHTANSMQRLAMNMTFNEMAATNGIELSDQEKAQVYAKANIGNAIRDVGNDAKKYWQDLAPKEQTFGDQVLRGIGQMAGQFPLFSFSPGLGIVTMYGQGADQMAGKIEKDKASQRADQAMQSVEVLSGGLITALTEWLSSKFLLNKIPQMTMLKNRLLNYTAKVAVGGVEEGIQETLENIGQDIAHIALTSPESKIAWTEAVEAGGVGAVVGTVASSIINGALHIRARGMQQAFRNISEASQDQPLRERSPQGYQSFSEAVADHLQATAGGELVNNVYIDANEFNQAVIHAKIDPQMVANDIPSIGGQIDKSTITGGDVIIPMQDYIGKIAGTELGAALEPHLRSGPDAVSISEMGPVMEMSKDFEAQANTILDDHEKRKEFAKSATQVRSDIYDQLMATGAYSPQVSRMMAQFNGAFYSNMAARTGVSPKAFYDSIRHNIVAGDLTGHTATPGKNQLWQMTKEEYDAAAKDQKIDASQNHEQAIQQAISEGKAVQPEVLKDYPAIAETQKDTFIMSKSGSPDLGVIDEAAAKQAGIPATVIRMRIGNNGYGGIHIAIAKGGKRLKEIISAGYEGVSDFVENVARNYNQIWKQPNGRLMLVKSAKNAQLAVIELFERDGGAHYDVITAFISPARYPEGGDRKMLWERSETLSTGTENTAPLLDTALESYGSQLGGTGRSGQSTNNLEQSDENVKEIADGSKLLWERSEPISAGTEKTAPLLDAALEKSGSQLDGTWRSGQSKDNIEPTGENVKENDSKLYQAGNPETVAILSGDEVGTDITADDAVELARNYYKEHLQGKTVERDGFGSVRLTGKGWKKLKRGLTTDAKKTMLIPAIPDIIAKGIYHGQFDLYKQRSDNIVAFHFFSGLVDLKGELTQAGVTVAEDSRGNLFYNLNHDTDALWEKLKAPRLPRLEARGVEPLENNEASPLNVNISPVDDDVKILFQSENARRGGFDPKTLTTILTQKADYSTFLHETAHLFLTTYAQVAADPNAHARMKDDMQTLLDWFGVPDLATWNNMTFEEQRKHHEAFAYNFEQYLFEGRAPNVRMQSMFERFAAWLKKVYISIRDDLNIIYRQEHGTDLPILTGEVRQVMDRMLASDEEIEHAEQVRGMAPIFQTQEEAGMNDAEWAAYQEFQIEAHETALAEHRAASLRQMKWVGNAKSRILRELQWKVRDIRRKITSEVAKEVKAQPVYRAMRFINTGLMEVQSRANREKRRQAVEFGLSTTKLSLPALREMYGEAANAPWRYLPKGTKNGLVAEEGIHPDVVADLFGFTSGDELVRAILDAKPVKEAIRDAAEQRMLEEHGELTDPKQLAAAVDAAVHNEARARFIAVEFRHLSKSQRPVRVMLEAARQAARSILGKRLIGDIHVGDYTAAEGRASREAEQAYQKRQSPETIAKTVFTREYRAEIKAGKEEAEAIRIATEKSERAQDNAQKREEQWKAKYGNKMPEEVAVQAKEHQLLQNQLAAEAGKIKTWIARDMKFFKKVFGHDKVLAKNRDMNYVQVARAILSIYGIGPHPEESATDYLGKIAKYDPEFFAEISPRITAHQAVAKPLKMMSVEEFTDLSEQIHALWHLSLRSRQIDIDGELKDRSEIVKDLNKQTASLIKAGNLALRGHEPTAREEMQIKLLGVRASMRCVEHWVDAMDKGNPDGPFRKNIWNPISEAVSRYRLAKQDYVGKYIDILKTAGPLLKGKNIEADELNWTFTPPQLLHALLHTGNDSNLRKLLVGRGWASISEGGVMDTSAWDRFIQGAIGQGIITKEHYDFCQAVWDLMDSMKPGAQKAHHAMYGFYFAEITAREFETPFGTYRGGYIPAVVDTRVVTEGEMRHEEETAMTNNSFMFPTTGKGFTMVRVDYDKPLLLNLGFLAGHIDKVLRFTYIEPHIKDVGRIVKNSRSFGESMDAFDRAARTDLLLPWLQRTAMQMIATPSKGWGGKAMDSVWTYLRNATGLQMMVGNISNTLQQFTGLSMSLVKVKPALMASAFWQYIRQPHETAEMILAKSDYMKTRINSELYELQHTMDSLLLDPNKYEELQLFAAQHGYFMQAATQNIVDIITWAGAYIQALDNIEVTEAEAIRRADSAVRETQGSFAPEDVSRIEASSPFVRAFVHFYSYFNMQANLLGTEFANVARTLGVRKGAGRMFYIYVCGFMIPALLSEIITQALGGFDTGDDEDFGLWDAVRLFFSSQARPLAAMVPGIGAAALAVGNMFTGKMHDDPISTAPSISMIEQAGRLPYDAYKAIADDGSWGRVAKDFLTGLGMVTKLPLGQAAKPISYAISVAEDKVEPRSKLDVARGLISGKDVNRKQ